MGFVRFGVVRICWGNTLALHWVVLYLAPWNSLGTRLPGTVWVRGYLEQPGYEATWNREGVSFVQEHSYKCRSGVCDLSSVRWSLKPFSSVAFSHVWEDREIEKTLQPCTGSFHSTGEQGGSIICI